MLINLNVDGLFYWCNPLQMRVSILLLLYISFVSCVSVHKQTEPQSEPYYIFRTKDLVYEEPEYGVFCSNHSLSDVYERVSSAFEYRWNCDNSEDLINVRKERATEFSNLIKKHPYNRYKRQIEKKVVTLGMHREVVLLIFGSPEAINTTTTLNGVYEQFVYPRMYIYFTNGKISTIQD